MKNSDKPQYYKYVYKIIYTYVMVEKIRTGQITYFKSSIFKISMWEDNIIQACKAEVHTRQVLRKL